MRTWLIIGSLAALVVACSSSDDASSSATNGTSIDAGSVVGDAAVGSSSDARACPAQTTVLADLVAHNTSASATYDQAHFPANFGSATWVSQAGATLAVDPNAADLSLNPVTPAHVSNVDVHSLVPSRPDLRWFAHITPWFKAGGGNHIDIGVDNDTDAYAKALVDDVRRRGFDGIIVDWYGQNSYEDLVTLRIQKYVATLPAGSFAFILMMDKGIPNLSKTVAETQIAYMTTQYFGDPAYEREGGDPIVMFFGVPSVLQDSGMTALKNEVGQHLVFVPENASSLASTWADECFDWTHDYHDGPSATDPYALDSLATFYSTVATSSKKAFGSMVAGFDGTLTDSVAWSKGKYLPRGDGACIVEWAKKIDAVIPKNVTRMQWATWSDWEEGTQVESGVENGASLEASIGGARLSWTITTASGDESTIDHFDVYASRDGKIGAKIATVPAGTHDTTLDDCVQSGDTIVVDAVGKPMIRDHASAAIRR